MMLGSDNVIKNLNLNESLVGEYRNNDHEMCSIKNSLWIDLIEFQKGSLSIEMLYQNKKKR